MGTKGCLEATFSGYSCGGMNNQSVFIDTNVCDASRLGERKKHRMLMLVHGRESKKNHAARQPHSQPHREVKLTTVKANPGPKLLAADRSGSPPATWELLKFQAQLFHHCSCLDSWFWC